jgi:CCR4-NOT transcription complex subunit 7/8
MRCNVDLLKIIQLGFTLSDEEGNTPPDTSTWQFNFRFSVKCVFVFPFFFRFWKTERASSESCHYSTDMFAPESIEFLQKSGIDFQRHEEIGILPADFAELMITSGLVLSPDTKWISFHR